MFFFISAQNIKIDKNLPTFVNGTISFRKVWIMPKQTTNSNRLYNSNQQYYNVRFESTYSNYLVYISYNLSSMYQQ